MCPVAHHCALLCYRNGRPPSTGTLVFFLIKLLFDLIFLPFKIILHIVDHSSRRRRTRKPRGRPPVSRGTCPLPRPNNPPPTWPYTPPNQARAPATPPTAGTYFPSYQPSKAGRSSTRKRNILVVAAAGGAMLLLVFAVAVGASGVPNTQLKTGSPGHTPSSRAHGGGAGLAAHGPSPMPSAHRHSPARPARAHRHHRKHHQRHRKHHRRTTPSAPASPPSAPVTTPSAPVTTSPAPVPTPAGCYPLASSGNCYEPGEFCPYADDGMTGVAGDGEHITCEDNDGLRWEPS
jgi:hypothetical protein